jgi:hypothetical protein
VAGFNLQAVPLPFGGVMMQEKGSVVLVDLLRSGRAHVFELILNEFQVNSRRDALGARFRRGRIHNRMGDSRAFVAHFIEIGSFDTVCD